MIQHYLQTLGFSDKDQAIYLMLAEIGIQPASVIARRCNLDRVTTYKHLKKLAERGYVHTYVRDGIQTFGIESFEALEEGMKKKVKTYEDMLGDLPDTLRMLKALKGSETIIPKMQIFEKESGMQALFRDILFELKEQKIKQIRILSANMFEEWTGDDALAKVIRTFFEDLRSRGTAVELFEATGGLVPEHLAVRSQKDLDLDQLPFARGTTNIFIAGHCVYFACYKGDQVGLKIKQAELSQILHFLFDLVQPSLQNKQSEK